MSYRRSDRPPSKSSSKPTSTATTPHGNTLSALTHNSGDNLTAPPHDKVLYPVNIFNQGSNARREARRTSNSGPPGRKNETPADKEKSSLSAIQTDLLFMKNTLAESYFLSSLLLFIPIGIFAGFYQYSDTVIFLTNFIGIIPLAWMLGNATEELADRTNQTIGGLLNATFGNAVELIVSVIALRKGYFRLVQTSLLGSILSNLLLVLGMSFLFGGIRHQRQKYNNKSAHVFTSMLLLACIAIAIPSAFNTSLSHNNVVDSQKISVLAVSRVTALIMFALYLLYLFFQLYTHADMFEDDDDDDDDIGKLSEITPLNRNGVNYGTDDRIIINEDSNLQEIAEEEDPEEEIHLSLVGSLSLLFAVTLCVSVCSEYLVDAIQGVCTRWTVPESFIGLVLLPIVGNAAEHATAVTVAIKDKLDLSIGVAVGSSTQIALFLIPFITLLGWIIGQPMTLDFTLFETLVLILSVLIVNFLVNSGETNWLEGAMLTGSYLIIAVAFYYHEEKTDIQVPLPGIPTIAP